VEKNYKVTIHLINGKKLRCITPTSTYDLLECYKALAMPEGRIKFPTRRNVQQFIPTRSVLRIEAKGNYK